MNLSIFRRLLFCVLCFFPLFLFCKNIALVTVAIGSHYYEATLPGILSKERYCALHGYDFICFPEMLDLSRLPPWQKIKAVEQALQQYDWILWSDADSIIMNEEISLEDLIDEEYSFIICFDEVSHVVNSGQFLIKNEDKSFDFLDRVYSKQEYLNHPWWENAAIIEALKEDAFSTGFAKILPQRKMNSFAFEVCGHNLQACYQPGDFIIHFPSIRDLPILKKLMRAYYDHRYVNNQRE